MTKLGVTLPQFTDDPARLLDGAQRAEALGFDSVWLFDHMWPLTGSKERPIFEAWSTLAFLAQRTERITIGTLVTRSSLRNAALLARMAATVASIAPGRLIIAIGSGDDLSRAENEAFGLPYYDLDERVPQMGATVKTLHLHLRGEHARVSAPGVDVDLPPGPIPEVPPPIWVAGRSDDVIEVAGTLADGWNAWGASPQRFLADVERVKEVAGNRRVEPTWAGQLMLGRDDAEAEEMLGSRRRRAFLVGGPETVRRQLGELVVAGASHLVCAFPQAGEKGTYERLAHDVRPGLDGYPQGV